MAAMDVNSPFTVKVLFNLKDLGIDQKFITEDRVTMESEKNICVRETNSVVIIDMTKPTQPIRLPITADFAIMNPDAPILAFKVQAKIDETTFQDQLQMYDINTKTTLKSCNIAEKVECCKWISPKLLGLVTLKAIYHWPIQGSTGPVKMFDITDVVGTSKITLIWNYMFDHSEKWVILMGLRDRLIYYPIFVRPYHGGGQWFRFQAHAAAFTTFHVDGNKTPSTLVCCAVGRSRTADNTSYIELSVYDRLGSQQGGQNFGKKQFKFDTDADEYVRAVQISRMYGLIFVITGRGLVSIHNLETAEGICSYNIIEKRTLNVNIILTVEGPSSESFYAINWGGQVLLARLNDSAILSFFNDKVQLTRGKLRDLQKLHREMSSENEGLKKQNMELQNELKTENAKLQAEIKQLAESLKVEQNVRRETEEQLRAKMTEIDNYQKSQEEMMNKLVDFRLLKETNNLEAFFTEYSRAELEKVTNGFSVSLKIGEGGYGRVYKALLGLKPVAIKMFNSERRNRVTEFNQEVEMMKTVSHPNIVKLLGACKETQALIYELMPNGSLYDILRNEQQRSALTSKIRIHIAFDICSGLIALHSAKPSIVHADLKPGNILLDLNYTAKLCDFGQSRHLQTVADRLTPHHYTANLKGTFLYWDNELFKAGEMTVQCDVHSFGIILLELVTGRDPMGLRKWAEDALSKGKIFVDASAGKWPLEEARKMVHLGLRCSEFSRKERPNLEKEVLPEIESMLRASLHF